MDVGTIITAIVGLFGGGILTKLVEALLSRGKTRRDSEKVAWDERDKEARRRRLLEEYAHRLRRLLFKRGAAEGPGEDDVPPWPTY